MRTLDFDGRMAISQTSISNRTEAIVQRFFCTPDVANLDASSSIKRIQLNGNNLPQSVSFETLIEVLEPNQMATPNFAYKLTCSLTM